MYRAAGPAVADFALQRTTVTKNSSTCFDEQCIAGGAISVTARTITANILDLTDSRASCVGDGCDVAPLYGLLGREGATIHDVEISTNETRCFGDACATRPVFAAQGGSGDVVLTKIGAQTNDSSCEGAECALGGQIDLFGRGILLEDAVVEGTQSSCNGEKCIARSVLSVDARERLVLRELAGIDNLARCRGNACATRGTIFAAGTSVEIDGAALEANKVFCDSPGCRAGSVLDVDGVDSVTVFDSSVLDSAVACIGEGCILLDVVDLFASAGRIDVEESLVRDNAVGCANSDCEARGVLAAVAPFLVTLLTTDIDQNVLSCTGARCFVEQLVRLSSQEVTLSSTVLESNESRCEGTSCRSAAIALLAGSESNVMGSRFARNRSLCSGTGCQVGLGGALQNTATLLSIKDTVFLSNATDGFGAAIFNTAGKEIVLERTTLESNAAGLNGTIEFGGAGGAIYNDASSGAKGKLTVRNSTIRSNRATFGGGGIFNEGVIAAFTGNQLAGNQPNDCTNFGGTGCP